ncbi:MAG: SBBP repeat-containing protein [Fimbriimonas sp.]|nr:SBBP repeat-containing protein [Fimbriimonas sp.]
MRISIVVFSIASLCSSVPCRPDDHDLRQRHGRTQAHLDKANDVATALVVDSSGNSYITGYSKGQDTGYDFLTLKYDSDGSLVWAQRLDGGVVGDDKAVAVQVDSTGNVFVTGSSQSSASNADYLTAKYDPTGKLLWKQRFNGTGDGFDTPTSMAVDGSGCVYVTGFSLSKGSGYDCVTIKYDAGGRLVWQKTFNGADNEDDFSEAVGIDRTGNCFITGYSKTAKQGANYLTIKYGPDGTASWVRLFSMRTTDIAKATALAVDGHGGVCVTGYAQGSHPTYDYMTIRYDDDGRALWSRRFDGSGHGNDKPAAIAMDDHGNYFVTGESFGGGSGSDFLTVKYSPDGSTLWQQRYDGSGLSDAACAMTLAAGNVVAVTGSSVSAESGSDILTVKYSEDGRLNWTERFNGATNDVDKPAGIASDTLGDIYVAGYSWGGKGSGFDYVVVKYNPDGKLLWQRRYDGGGTLQ